MERYLGLDVHAGSCTLAVLSQSGKRLSDLVVETNGQARADLHEAYGGLWEFGQVSREPSSFSGE